jgi:hypothetical protein
MKEGRIMKFYPALLMAAVLLGGCAVDPIVRQQQIDRAKLTEEPVMLPTPTPAVAGVSPTDPRSIAPPVVPEVKGTYVFSTPPTVTQIHQTTAAFDQFVLYMGRPQPADKPFMVITVAEKVSTYSDNPLGNYTVANKRTYIMNGLIVAETTGFTKDKHFAFSEIVAKRPGGGDQLLAVTIVPDAATREAALAILQTLKWEQTR